MKAKYGRKRTLASLIYTTPHLRKTLLEIDLNFLLSCLNSSDGNDVEFFEGIPAALLNKLLLLENEQAKKDQPQTRLLVIRVLRTPALITRLGIAKTYELFLMAEIVAVLELGEVAELLKQLIVYEEQQIPEIEKRVFTLRVLSNPKLRAQLALTSLLELFWDKKYQGYLAASEIISFREHCCDVLRTIAIDEATLRTKIIEKEMHEEEKHDSWGLSATVLTTESCEKS